MVGARAPTMGPQLFNPELSFHHQEHNQSKKLLSYTVSLTRGSKGGPLGGSQTSRCLSIFSITSSSFINAITVSGTKKWEIEGNN